jgi:flagellar motility protein MotE (MotC chaperone)
MKLRKIIIVFSLATTVCTVDLAVAAEKLQSANNADAESSKDFCRSFADKAAESKLLRHKQELLDLKAKIEEQLSALKEKTQHLEELTAKRNEYRSAVSASLVKIYTNVEPDIAAQQLEKLSVEMASEVLQKLSPKISGEIVTAMDVKLASKVVKLMLINSSKKNGETQKP